MKWAFRSETGDGEPTNLAIARQWYDREHVDVIIDVPTSAIAFGVHALAQQFTRLLIFSSAGSVDLTEKSWNPHSITWTYDTYVLARAVATEVTRSGGTSCHFIAADYVFGQQLEADATRFIKAACGKVLGHSRQPINTTEFSQPVLEAQASGARVLGVAHVGLDMINTIKQAAEFGLLSQSKMRPVALIATESEISGLGLQLG